MDQSTPPESDLTAAFRQLGDNLKRALQAAWESQERQQLQNEVVSGLAELERVLRETGQDFTQGETGQRLKEELEDLRNRVRTGEVQARVSEELLSALRTLSAELEKAARTWSTPTGGGDPQPPTEEA
jgi:ElaB/YqjD/DUF883 family membrane-anchored ribosome-binding protein